MDRSRGDGGVFGSTGPGSGLNMLLCTFRVCGSCFGLVVIIHPLASWDQPLSRQESDRVRLLWRFATHPPHHPPSHGRTETEHRTRSPQAKKIFDFETAQIAEIEGDTGR